VLTIADGFEGAELNPLPKLPKRARRRARAKHANTLVLVKGALPTPCFDSHSQNTNLALDTSENTPAERPYEQEQRKQPQNKSVSSQDSGGTRPREKRVPGSEIEEVQGAMVRLFKAAQRTIGVSLLY
jgi:hypothetical protein